jgi:uncharacterized membrane protein YkvA (DUF1232 family)
MNEWLIGLTIVAVFLLAIGLTAIWLFWSRRRRARELMERIGALPWRAKTQLAGELFRDPRVPVAVRIAMPLLVLYLVLPIDLIPDFIPVIGQVDDLILIVLVAGLLLRAVPMDVVWGHIEELELAYGDFIEGEARQPADRFLGPGTPGPQS